MLFGAAVSVSAVGSCSAAALTAEASVVKLRLTRRFGCRARCLETGVVLGKDMEFSSRTVAYLKDARLEQVLGLRRGCCYLKLTPVLLLVPIIRLRYEIMRL
jgi:hypothetical protein